MPTLQINHPAKEHKNVFIMVKKSNPDLYQLFKSYTFLDTHRNYLGRYYIHSIEVLRISQIDTATALLDKECPLSNYIEILKEIDKVTDSDLLYKMVFSNQRPVKDY